MNYLAFEQLPVELQDRASYQDIVVPQILVQHGETAGSITIGWRDYFPKQIDSH
ncbi:MAG: hypothetical protein AAF298_20925 [Cyanobacteria bacterium P01_A01_bin.40]